MRRPRRRGATPATCKIAGHQPALLLWAMARPSLAISLSPPPGVEARPDTPEPETALPLCGSWPVCVGRREGAVRRRNPLSHIDFRYSACLSKRLDSGNFLFSSFSASRAWRFKSWLSENRGCVYPGPSASSSCPSGARRSRGAHRRRPPGGHRCAASATAPEPVAAARPGRARRPH